MGTVYVFFADGFKELNLRHRNHSSLHSYRKAPVHHVHLLLSHRESPLSFPRSALHVSLHPQR